MDGHPGTNQLCVSKISGAANDFKLVTKVSGSCVYP